MKIDAVLHKYRQYIIPLILILAFTSFFFHYFTETVRLGRESEESGQIEEIASISSRHVRNRIETYMRFASTAAQQVSRFKDIRSPEVSLVINRVAKDTNVDFIEILYPDGSRRTSSASMFTKSDSNFYTSSSRVFTSVINGQNYITFSSPVKKDGRIVAQVRGSIRSAAMDTVMHNKALNSGGTMFFMHDHGIWLYPQERGSILSRVGNIFDFMQQPGVTVSVPLERVMNAFTNNESLFFRYTKDGISRLSYITPLGLSDWYLGVMMPASSFTSKDTDVAHDALTLLHRILVLFFILGIFILYREKQHSQKIYAANKMEEEIIANIPGGVQKFTANNDFSYEFVSHGFVRMTACGSVDETISMFGGSFWNSILEEDREKTKKYILKRIAQNSKFEATYRMRRKDGKTIYVLCSGSPARNTGRRKSICCVTLDISKMQEATDDLKMRNKMYEIATSEADIFILEYSPENDTLHISPKSAQKFGLQSQITALTELLTAAVEDSANTDGVKSMPEAFLEMLTEIKNGAKSASESHYLISGTDGKKFYVTTHFTAVYNENCELIKIIGVIRDDTESRAVVKEYLLTEKYKDTLLSLYDRVYEYDLTHDKIIKGSDYYLKYLPQDMMTVSGVKKYFTEIYSHPEDRPTVLNILTEKGSMEYLSKGINEIDLELRTKTDKDSDEYRWKSAHISIFIDPSDSSVRNIWYFKDITESVRKTEHLRFMAERDPLTRLFNKKTAETLIREKLNTDLMAGTEIMNAFAMLDLDDFKNVNDQLGHVFGDAVIEEVGRRINDTFRSTDIVGRIGGDEFIVFMKDIPSTKIAMIKIHETAARIREIQSDRTKDIPISASIGVVFSPENGTSLEELYNKADIALYRSKDAGKDNITVYDKSMGTEFDRTGNILGEIESTEGGNFSDNMPRHTFKMLCDAKNLRLSVSLVLELISKHFGFQRGYIFRDSEDGLTCSQIYEWCAEGIEPEIDKCRNVLYSESFRGLKEAFSEDSIYLYKKSNNPDAVPQAFKPGHKNTGISVAMLDAGEYKGFIGFDCSEEVAAMLTQKQISDITLSAQVVVAFILSAMQDTRNNNSANTF